MVGFLVMLKTSEFAGVGHSRFSWNVGRLRHVYAQKKDHLSGPQILSDELSQIYGHASTTPMAKSTTTRRFDSYADSIQDAFKRPLSKKPAGILPHGPFTNTFFLAEAMASVSGADTGELRCCSAAAYCPSK